ncbi:hypothetical protein Hypma_008496 [Hypsizygus marmoreus]|uniref:Uncharacterized protein n=1 Tax=Hypsizygus marmoreus TaxID=39966 RepID=A0A369K0B1_HYPMA|nr:hypothetical protein Hypma_008496 [Hypsizygus marmoreus]
MVPSLRERVVEGSEEEILDAAHSIQKGVDAARADDTKNLKVVVLRWITPPGQALQPPLYPDQKRTRGFKHPRTGELLCPVEYDWKDPEIRRQLKEDLLVPSGDSWPILLYADFVYDPDDPWKGLFRSSLLVKAFKHIFTSPSSANEYRNDDKSVPKSGNARIHGMMEVTRASIAYVAMQLRFSLCTANMFSRNDKLTDSGRFYDSIMELLEDEDEQAEVEELLEWWNGQVFPGWSRIAVRKPASENSPLAKIRKARALKKAAEAQAIAAGETTVIPAAPKVYVIDDSDVE